jgi:ribulose kinase
MATKSDLQDWVQNALSRMGGRGSLTDVAKEIWRAHESELRSSGDLFYTWQYDMRWAANRLRSRAIMQSVAVSGSGVWALA